MAAMTIPIKIYEAMKSIRDARDLLEASSAQTDDDIECANLKDWADDMTSLLASLELTYGELAA